jgi:uncharacterized protein YjiS (DUF1127 family)
MESAMGDTEDFYFLRFDHRPLTPEQWDALKRSAVRHAKENRARLLRGMFGAILTSVQRVAQGGRALGSRAASAARRRWRSYVIWRERRHAVKELGGLDDRVLKDIGLHRSEIESVIYARDAGRVIDGKGATVLVHKPQAKQDVATKGRSEQMIERSAA